MTKPTVTDIWGELTQWAPARLAEPWDNIGLQVGDPATPVSRAVVALDASPQVLKFAQKEAAQLVFTHHPLLFRPLNALDLSKFTPRLLAGFLRAGIALASGHTNLDSARGGMNDVLAEAFGIVDTEPLRPAPEEEPGGGLGRIGELERECSLEQLAEKTSRLLGTPCLSVVGAPNAVIRRVALCGGSGSDLWHDAVNQGADCFISAEIKHHIAREAEQTGNSLIDAGHFFTEWPIVPAVCKFLRARAREHAWNLDVVPFTEERSPFAWWLHEPGTTGRFLRGILPSESGYGIQPQGANIES